MRLRARLIHKCATTVWSVYITAYSDGCGVVIPPPAYCNIHTATTTSRARSVTSKPSPFFTPLPVPSTLAGSRVPRAALVPVGRVVLRAVGARVAIAARPGSLGVRRLPFVCCTACRVHLAALLPARERHTAISQS